MYSSSSGGSYLSTMRPDYLFLKYVLSDTGSQRRSVLPQAPVAVTSLAFDRQEELLWMGNETGHVTSYYGLDLAKYTSFQVHAQNDIRAQVTGDYGLLSLTKNSLRMSIRRGLTVFDHTSDYLKDMYCMALTENPHVVLMAGQQSQVLEFDLEKVKPIRVTEISSSSADDESGCMIIRDHPKFACCGDAFGKVSTQFERTERVT
jgi:PAB-dependent poly(A)-specific ribonuclease subunit 2